MNLPRVVAVLAICMIAALAKADDLIVNPGLYQSGSGGEFKIESINGFAGLTGLASDTSASTFQTFCVEKSEYIYYGERVDVVINTKSEKTGTYLNNGTAWLFSQFRTKGLASNYAYDAGATSRKADADLLQQAIWMLMGEQTKNWSNKFMALVDTAMGQTAALNTDNIGNVRIMNLWKDGNTRQDMLTMIPLPAPLGIGIVGLLGVGVATRRRRW